MSGEEPGRGDRKLEAGGDADDVRRGASET